jgi:uncharacterized repeat protein (TIGR03803 family)
MTSDGALTSLASFHNYDGVAPRAELVEWRDGSLFGTAPFGGIRAEGAPDNVSPGTGDVDFGTVFKVTTDKVLTVIFRFERTNGFTPLSRLVQGPDDYFYGTTERGGAHGHGTAFRISANGEFKSLFDFGGTNGVEPNGLMLAMDGNLYGTTRSGGLGYQCTVFRADSPITVNLVNAYYAAGLGQAKLTSALIERKLGTVTLRNWNTVTALLELAKT